jgi:hypothetical protein
MTAKSIHGNSPEDIQTALHESMADGFKPTLAVVFVSVKQDRKALSELLQKEGNDIFGATSCGEFINEYQSKGGIVVLLMDLSRNSYTLLPEETGKRSIQEAADLPVCCATYFPSPGL